MRKHDILLAALIIGGIVLLYILVKNHPLNQQTLYTKPMLTVLPGGVSTAELTNVDQTIVNMSNQMNTKLN